MPVRPNQLIASELNEVREAIAPLADQPVWLLLTLTCFAHGWAHLEEIRLLARAGRAVTA